MNQETIELIREAAAQAAGLFKEVSPQIWEMARIRVVAGIIIPSMAAFVCMIIALLIAFHFRKYKDANDEDTEYYFLIPTVFFGAFSVLFIILIFCGIYDYITIEYQTFQAIKELILK